ncbi:GSCOCG00013456001-RA-CDS [Cotesia congregata]|uniref:Mevalonate kinase n=1 Tax=Cotesia congregata TaxID=51543 RepID=A0A8J2EKR8_COTCN|nr:GSCOCG00013456001-RA-CDS [Cotesia congregata]CAG5075918.1 Similar to MVK: Mevalonate kinase (Bos taurus) [Cotesia congregata]
MNFLVSAPGKVILFGEHAVVYGKTAVAASLDLRTTLQFNELDGQNILLSMPKLDLKITVSLAEVIELSQNSPKLTEEKHEEFYEFVSKFVDKLQYSGIQKLGLEALFYLLIAVTQSESLEIKPFSLFLDTKLSIGSGLGSSASFAVCISTSFLHWANLQKNKLTKLDELELQKISKFAMGCEKIMHGTPSGIDHTVAIYGAVIEFKKPDKLDPIFGVKTMEILLVDTRVPRSTKDLVAKFKELKIKFPGIVDAILDAIDQVAQEALKVIRKMRTLDDEDHWRDLGALVEVNHGLLASCQVSHPALEKICAVARENKLKAKMTGAGGGGYAYVLLPPGVEEEKVQQVTETMQGYGFLVTRSSLGGPGVKID